MPRLSSSAAIAIACSSSESGIAVWIFENAVTRHTGGTGPVGFAAMARCASSTAWTTIDGPSDGSGHDWLIVGCAGAVGVGAGVGVADFGAHAETVASAAAASAANATRELRIELFKAVKGWRE